MGETHDTLPQRAPANGESQVPPGDQGDTSLLSDPHRTKSDLALLRRCIRERWGVPAERKRRLVERACEIGEQCPDEDTALSAIRTTVAMDAADMQALATLDKMERLDAGEATENVAVRTVRYVIEEAAHEQPAPPPTTPPASENPN